MCAQGTLNMASYVTYEKWLFRELLGIFKNNIQQNKIFCKKFQLKIYYRTENRLYKTGVWVIYGTKYHIA